MNPRPCIKWIAALVVLTLLAAACGSNSPDLSTEPTTALQAGAASRIITPPHWETWTDIDGNHVFDGDIDDPDGPEPFIDANGDGRFDAAWLAGTHDGRAAISVHDDLEVNVTVFTDGDRTIALAGVDALVSRLDLTETARERLASEGLNIDSFNWMSTHSHEALAPLPIELNGELTVNNEYWDFVIDQVVDATTEAYEAMEPAVLTLADAATPIEPGDELQADVRAPTVIDNVATVMRFDRADGDSTLATVVHWGNHPEMVSWDNQISADFPGVVRKRLEAEYPGSVAVFIQGALGSQINGEDASFSYDGIDYPDEEGPWSQGSFAKADALGNRLADIVIDALENHGDRQHDCGITAAEHYRINAAVDNPQMIVGARAVGASLVNADGTPHTDGQVYLQDEVAHIAVCDLEILTNPGEVAPELVVGFAGEAGWKDYLNSRYRMVTSLTNGLVGYLVDPSNWELDPSNPWGYWGPDHYDETGSFSVKNAAIIDAAYRELLDIPAVQRRRPIEVIGETLDGYVGTYGTQLQIVRTDIGLVALLPRFGTGVDLYAATDVDFYATDLDVEITFGIDGEGSVAAADVTLPGSTPETVPFTGTEPPAVIDADLVAVFVDEIGVSFVLPRHWVEGVDGDFTDGTSQLAVLAVETSQVTDPTTDGFELIGEFDAGTNRWRIYTQSSGGVVTGLALTELGDVTYGLLLETPSALAETVLDTVVIPALAAFTTSPLSGVSGGFDGIEIDKVEVDGVGFAYVAQGAGPVTVVFEAGLGSGMNTWSEILPSVADYTRAFAYDRPGYGDSDPSDADRDAATMVEDLRRLLAATGYQAPYLLVGHSLGGTVMDLFARTHPDEVAGLVLVDSRHHTFTQRCVDQFGPETCPLPTAEQIASAPEPIAAELRAASLTEAQLASAPPLTDMPLVVITAGIIDGDPGVVDLWRQTQADYASQTASAELIVADTSDHAIPVRQPDLIIDVIVDLLEGMNP